MASPLQHRTECEDSTQCGDQPATDASPTRPHTRSAMTSKPLLNGAGTAGSTLRTDGNTRLAPACLLPSKLGDRGSGAGGRLVNARANEPLIKHPILGVAVHSKPPDAPHTSAPFKTYRRVAIGREPRWLEQGGWDRPANGCG